jgi:hypothetical protein
MIPPISCIITNLLPLYHYSFNKTRVDELIDYITVMPPDGCSHDRGHKFPFYANRIFNEGGDGVPNIIEQLFFANKKVQLRKAIKL